MTLRNIKKSTVGYTDTDVHLKKVDSIGVVGKGSTRKGISPGISGGTIQHSVGELIRRPPLVDQVVRPPWSRM
jgi:hypothetical protein